MENFIEVNFADMKQSKNSTVVPLSAMSNTVKVNKTVIVDPLVIFQRTLINKRQMKTSPVHNINVINHFGEIETMLVDRYGDLNSTKNAEQKKRGRTKLSVEPSLLPSRRTSLQLTRTKPI